MTFAEQVPGLTVRYQRRTPQLQRLVAAVGVVLAGRGGSRMLRILNVALAVHRSVSADAGAASAAGDTAGAGGRRLAGLRRLHPVRRGIDDAAGAAGVVTIVDLPCGSQPRDASTDALLEVPVCQIDSTRTLLPLVAQEDRSCVVAAAPLISAFSRKGHPEAELSIHHHIFTTALL
ncbi:hypothetical protein [Streptomyces spiramyceticus]|uniref:hypothetical protein n=1 Tax=Streptomyces spiramyceticus TaxID=299717 RepID=UPI00237BF25D|nr:hypothetical protein [Streptomyces spiramyceticus]